MKEMVLSLKENVLKYVKDSFKNEKKKVSVRDIQKKFSCSTTIIYKLFPGKKAEIYSLAGVPIDQKTMEQTKVATAAKRSSKKTVALSYFLTEDQTKKILGLSYWEGGKDLSQVLDEILELELKNRRVKLTLKERKMIWSFLESAFNNGWKIGEDPDIIQFIISLWNLGIHRQDPEIIKGIIETVKCLRVKNWKISAFVDYATRHKNQFQLYRAYMDKKITKEEFYKEIEAYVS